MGKQALTCPMCGHSFDPLANLACPSCPINSSCTLTCCPQCGYETVNPDRSTVVNLLRKFSARIRPDKVSDNLPSQEA